MAIRVLLGALLSAVVLMVWGTVFWMALPFASWVMKPLPNGDATAKSLKDSVPETGVYFYPCCCDTAATEEQRKAAEAKHREGPLVQVIYHREGSEPMAPLYFIKGFLHLFACALLAGGLLWMANLRCWATRILFVFLVGLFASLAVHGGELIWWEHPWQFALFQGGYNASNWLLTGLVLAPFIRPRQSDAVEEQPAERAGGLPHPRTLAGEEERKRHGVRGS